jgi:hypothetical protein
MTGRTRRRLARRTLLGLTATALLTSAIACTGTGTSTGTSTSTAPGSSRPTLAPEPSPTSNALGSGWTGTVTFKGVIDVSKEKTDTSGNPGSVYYAPTTTKDVTQTDATDEFTVTGKDPEDITYGIQRVDLGGSAANHGTTLERYLITSDRHNALSCHFTDETGSETVGSWTGNLNGVGEISFSEDGSYHITMSAGGDPKTGERPPSPQLPHRIWEKVTILAGAARDCPGPGYESKTTEGPIVEWASSFLGTTDVNGIYSSIHGKLNPTNPGSVVDGTATFKLSLPEMQLTISWHLVHDGPITLPHS